MRVLKIIWEIFCCSFSSLSDFFCVKRPDGMFGDIRTVILNVRTYILVVRTIQVLRPDVFGYRPDGEPYRVKSFSPRAAALLLGSFWLDFVVFCFFFSMFLCKTL
jgi:hypothetical protein